MAERQQDLVKASSGEAVQKLVGNIAQRILRRTLGSGKPIHIPSLGLAGTPDGKLKEVKNLTVD